MKLPKTLIQILGSAIFVVIFPGASLAAIVYSKTFNQFMGVESTGEQVELLQVKVSIRGGFAINVIYRIGRDTVESGINCPSFSGDNYDGNQPYFRDQGKRYAQSNATSKILSLACQYEQKILTSSNIPSTSP